VDFSVSCLFSKYWIIINCFSHSFPEIGKVRGNLFQINGKKNEPLVLPDAAGAPVSLSEKVYVPLKDHPEVRDKSIKVLSLQTILYWAYLGVYHVQRPNFTGRPVVNFINIKSTIFCMNVRFSSFYNVYVTRKSCQNDIRMKSARVLHWWNWRLVG